MRIKNILCLRTEWLLNLLYMSLLFNLARSNDIRYSSNELKDTKCYSLVSKMYCFKINNFPMGILNIYVKEIRAYQCFIS